MAKAVQVVAEQYALPEMLHLFQRVAPAWAGSVGGGSALTQSFQGFQWLTRIVGSELPAAQTAVFQPWFNVMPASARRPWVEAVNHAVELYTQQANARIVMAGRSERGASSFVQQWMQSLMAPVRRIVESSGSRELVQHTPQYKPAQLQFPRFQISAQTSLFRGVFAEISDALRHSVSWPAVSRTIMESLSVRLPGRQASELSQLPFNALSSSYGHLNPASMAIRRFSTSSGRGNPGGAGKGSGDDGGKGPGFDWKGFFQIGMLVGGLVVYFWQAVRDFTPVVIKGDAIDDPMAIPGGGSKRLIKDGAGFEHVGNKENGRMPGEVVQQVGKQKYYVNKSVNSREAAINEVIAGDVLHLIRGAKAPKTKLKQTRLGDGSAVFTVLSQILGHGQENMEPGRDLEGIARRYDVNEEFGKKHPIRDAGVALAADLLLGKISDIKLANLVAFRKRGRDGDCYHVHGIDNEYAFRYPAAFSLDPEELINLIKDIRPLAFDEKVQGATKLHGDLSSFTPDEANYDRNVPLRGKPEAERMKKILMPVVALDIAYVARLYEEFAALDPDKLRNIPKKLTGFLTVEEQEKYANDLLARQDATKRYIAENKDRFAELREERERAQAAKEERISRTCEQRIPPLVACLRADMKIMGSHVEALERELKESGRTTGRV